MAELIASDQSPTPHSRFDYVKYDAESQARQEILKKAVQILEAELELYVDCPRSKASALTKLEECYAWAGKGIRNDQIKRNKTTELQEGRSNS